MYFINKYQTFIIILFCLFDNLYSTILLEKNLHNIHHQITILNKLFLNEPVYLNGFTYNKQFEFLSHNTNGNSHYFKIEKNLKDISYNYNFLQLSCDVSAVDLTSNFEPMGLGLHCKIFFTDSTSKDLLLNINEGTYTYTNYNTSCSINKKISEIILTGFHRGSSASGSVAYKDIVIELNNKSLNDGLISINNYYYNLGTNKFQNSINSDINKLITSDLIEGFFIDKFDDRLQKIHVIDKNSTDSFIIGNKDIKLHINIQKELKKDYISIVPLIIDTPFKLYFILPLTDTRFIETSLGDKTLLNIISQDELYGTKRQPWIASNNLGISHDFNSTSHYKFVYNKKLNSLIHSIDFGNIISKNTSSAKFYLHHDISSLRDIVSFHIRNNKQSLIENGLFMFFGSDIFLDIDRNYLDLFRFHETDPSYNNNIINFNSSHDIISFDYIEPHTFWIKYINNEVSTIKVDDLFNILFSGIHQDFVEHGLRVPVSRLKGWLTSSQLNFDNLPYVDSVDFPWANGFGLYPNPDPNIPPSINYQNHFNEFIVPQLDRLDIKERPNSGYFIDSVSDYNKKNYNQNHFKHLKSNLSVDDSGNPYIETRQSIIEFLKRTKSLKPHKPLMLNGAAMDARFVPYADFILEEIASNLDHSLISRIRSFALNKPVTCLYTGNYEQKYINRLLNLNLLYNIGISPSTDYWLDSALLNRDQELLENYHKSAHYINKTYWRPLQVFENNNSFNIEHYFSNENSKSYICLFANEEINNLKLITLSHVHIDNVSILNKDTGLKFSSNSISFSDLKLNKDDLLLIELDLLNLKEQNFSDLKSLGNNFYLSDWFGIFYFNHLNWIYHLDHGWIYLSQYDSKEGFWFWKQSLGWCYTGAEIYPYIYNQNVLDWFYYNSETLRYYNYSIAQYENH